MSDAATVAAGDAAIPLCVDFDCTLIRSDTLAESMLELVARHPAAVLWLFVWLLRGKAALKARVAERVLLDPTTLPYRDTFVAWVREQAKERPVVLVASSHRLVAERVAGYLGFFSELFATDNDNLEAHGRANGLVARYGERAFDYAGHSSADLRVWQHARQGILVGARRRVAQAARASTHVVLEFEPAPGLRVQIATWARALRLYQWVKNLLIFVAPAAAHMLQQPGTLAASGLAFLVFGLASSGVYLINDSLDLASDRAHPRKRHRPFAAGTLPLSRGLVVAPLLLATALAIGLTVSTAFFACLCVYVAVTTAYSLWLRRKAFMDTAVLAALYTLRVVAGAAATGIALSFWLLAVCAYGFLGLALVKRYSELHPMNAAAMGDATGRGYRPGDMPVVLALGVGASLLATLVTALYIDSPASDALYAHPELLWLLVILMLLGVGRIWLMGGRGEMHDDPIVFVTKDRWSLLLLALSAVVVFAAT